MGEPPVIATTMPRGELARLCLFYGDALTVDLAQTDDGQGTPLDGARLLWAMSGRESSFGHNLTPRHEAAYDVGGLYYRTSAELREGIAQYGRSFACSYGPLQILAVNAKGFSPAEMAEDPERGLQAAVVRLRLHVLHHQQARTIGQICECWNAGHEGGTTTPGYVEEVTHNYWNEVIA